MCTPQDLLPYSVWPSLGTDHHLVGKVNKGGVEKPAGWSDVVEQGRIIVSG